MTLSESEQIVTEIIEALQPLQMTVCVLQLEKDISLTFGYLAEEWR